MAVVTEAEIRAALSRVQDPELHRSVVELGMIRDLAIHEGAVRFTLALTIPECPLREQLTAEARAAVETLPGVKDVIITLGAMTDEERTAALGHAQPESPKANPFNDVRQVVAVMSGKGGVGKSSVAALLALALARQGHQVGILDADITGPSIPKLFGLRAGGVSNSPMGILPPVAAGGVKVMSINLLLPDEDTPVIWRGPLISGTIRQFWTDVVWGQLDYLLVDLPPGTSDAALTVMQSLPVNGIVIVTTPQELAAIVVRKAVHMAAQLKAQVLGVVENMSYFVCPDTGQRHNIFGPSHAEEVAAAAQAPVLARLPIDPDIAALCDAGEVALVARPEVEALAAALCRLALAPSPATLAQQPVS
jgi:Mrp family chromosome partitioning ATPase